MKEEEYLNMPRFVAIVGKTRLKTVGVFYQSLFNRLEEGKRVLLIKYNHRNTYNHFITMATVMKKTKELVHSFKLTEIELYEHENTKVVSLIKKLKDDFDSIFIEKPNCINDYEFIDTLKKLSHSLKKNITLLPQFEDDKINITELKEYNDITYLIVDDKVILDIFTVECFFPKQKKCEVIKHKIVDHCVIHQLED